jgi:hypothetical protein
VTNCNVGKAVALKTVSPAKTENALDASMALLSLTMQTELSFAKKYHVQYKTVDFATVMDNVFNAISTTKISTEKSAKKLALLTDAYFAILTKKTSVIHAKSKKVSITGQTNVKNTRFLAANSLDIVSKSV